MEGFALSRASRGNANSAGDRTGAHSPSSAEDNVIFTRLMDWRRVWRRKDIREVADARMVEEEEDGRKEVEVAGQHFEKQSPPQA